MPKFDVTLKRVSTETAVVTVDVSDEDFAEQAAIEFAEEIKTGASVCWELVDWDAIEAVDYEEHEDKEPVK